jgi:hypothetical protein
VFNGTSLRKRPGQKGINQKAKCNRNITHVCGFETFWISPSRI